MRHLFQPIAIAVLMGVPVISTAESNAPVSRDQVRAELVELERAGYHVGDDDPHYPDAIQAAEARVAGQHSTPSGYGGVGSQSSLSGGPMIERNDAYQRQVYFGQ
jgi:hypothetical protein